MKFYRSVDFCYFSYLDRRLGMSIIGTSYMGRCFLGDNLLDFRRRLGMSMIGTSYMGRRFLGDNLSGFRSLK